MGQPYRKQHMGRVREPDVQADPLDAQIFFISNIISSDSPSIN